METPKRGAPLLDHPGSYGFARGFCIFRVSPPGGDEPRPYMGISGSVFSGALPGKTAACNPGGHVI